MVWKPRLGRSGADIALEEGSRLGLSLDGSTCDVLCGELKDASFAVLSYRFSSTTYDDAESRRRSATSTACLKWADAIRTLGVADETAEHSQQPRTPLTVSSLSVRRHLPLSCKPTRSTCSRSGDGAHPASARDDLARNGRGASPALDQSILPFQRVDFRGRGHLPRASATHAVTYAFSQLSPPRRCSEFRWPANRQTRR